MKGWTIETKIFDRATIFNVLLDSKYYPSIDPSVYDGVGNVMRACDGSVIQYDSNGAPVLDGNNEVVTIEPNGSAGRYNLPAFDKYIFFDAVHFSRRAHQFMGNVLADFIK